MKIKIITSIVSIIRAVSFVKFKVATEHVGPGSSAHFYDSCQIPCN